MALHPLREALGQSGLHAFHHESTFKANADLGWKAERNLSQMVSDAWRVYQQQA